MSDVRTGIVCGNGRQRGRGKLWILPSPHEPKVPLYERDNDAFFWDLEPGMRIAFTPIRSGDELRARCNRVIDPRSTSSWLLDGSD